MRHERVHEAVAPVLEAEGGHEVGHVDDAAAARVEAMLRAVHGGRSGSSPGGGRRPAGQSRPDVAASSRAPIERRRRDALDPAGDHDEQAEGEGQLEQPRVQGALDLSGRELRLGRVEELVARGGGGVQATPSVTTPPSTPRTARPEWPVDAAGRHGRRQPPSRCRRSTWPCPPSHRCPGLFGERPAETSAQARNEPTAAATPPARASVAARVVRTDMGPTDRLRTGAERAPAWRPVGRLRRGRRRRCRGGWHVGGRRRPPRRGLLLLLLGPAQREDPADEHQHAAGDHHVDPDAERDADLSRVDRLVE